MTYIFMYDENNAEQKQKIKRANKSFENATKEIGLRTTLTYLLHGAQPFLKS